MCVCVCDSGSLVWCVYLLYTHRSDLDVCLCIDRFCCSGWCIDGPRDLHNGPAGLEEVKWNGMEHTTPGLLHCSVIGQFKRTHQGAHLTGYDNLIFTNTNTQPRCVCACGGISICRGISLWNPKLCNENISNLCSHFGNWCSLQCKQRTWVRLNDAQTNNLPILILNWLINFPY